MNGADGERSGRQSYLRPQQGSPTAPGQEGESRGKPIGETDLMGPGKSLAFPRAGQDRYANFTSFSKQPMVGTLSSSFGGIGSGPESGRLWDLLGGLDVAPPDHPDDARGLVGRRDGGSVVTALLLEPQGPGPQADRGHWLTDARHRRYRRPVLPVGYGPSLEPREEHHAR